MVLRLIGAGGYSLRHTLRLQVENRLQNLRTYRRSDPQMPPFLKRIEKIESTPDESIWTAKPPNCGGLQQFKQ